ncbi:MAG: hypothetical protein K6B67_03220 [Lachnospiraceae bacterium]|nr:hypothetical protein [Lachnospiraceae bacterium]
MDKKKDKKNLNYYVMKYLVVPRTPKIIPGKEHIACIGDSITYGAGVRGKTKNTWENFLNQSLGSDVQVINYGISGRTLQDEGDFPYCEEKFYEISKQSEADIYLIMLGTNDSKPYNWNETRFRKRLESFAREYMNLKHQPKVVLMTPPQCFPDKKTGVVPFDIDATTIATSIRKIVFEVADVLNLDVIDLNDYTKGHPEWFADGVHPNIYGDKKIAECIYDTNILER